MKTPVSLLSAALVALTVSAVAQQPAAAPTFDVASVRPSRTSLAPEESEVQPSGQFVVTNMTLDNLVRGVFEVQRHELVLGERVPSWFASDKWDIVGKGPPITNEATQQPLLRAMMRNLLVERFKLVTRREMRDTPIYALVVARADRRLGPQMRPSSADCAALAAAFRATGARQTPDSPVCGLITPRGLFRGRGVPLGDLARALTRMTERPVVDATDLTGFFDLELKWTPDNAPGPTSDASLFTAVQEQLGLRLEPRRAPVRVLVIESLERPAPE
jgi:uncharacterized protein (TIGR03435 family)